MPTSTLAAALAAGVADAAARCYAHGVLTTPLLATPLLSDGCASAWLKLESEQITGSFKVRGAVNALASLPPEQRCDGVVTASSGNHAKAVAYALKNVLFYDDAPPGAHQIWLPSTVAPTKLASLQRENAPLRLTTEPDMAKVEAAARAYADSVGAKYVSPYNDAGVLLGQATVGCEIAHQLETALERLESRTASSSAASPLAAGASRSSLSRPVVVFVPVGGGGLAVGAASALKSLWHGSSPLSFDKSDETPQPTRGRVVVIGVQPSSNACAARSAAAGRILGDGEFEDGPTWSDGTAGGMEAGAITFEGMRRAATERDDVLAMLKALPRDGGDGVITSVDAPIVDAFWCVSENAIKRSMKAMIDEHHKVVEGAAGAALAAAAELSKSGALSGCHVVVVVCACNVGTSRLRELLGGSSRGGSVATSPERS